MDADDLRLEERASVDIHISEKYISVSLGRPLSDGKPGRIEVLAASALIGVAKALAGYGEADVAADVAKMTRRRGRK